MIPKKQSISSKDIILEIMTILIITICFPKTSARFKQLTNPGLIINFT